MLNRIRDLFFDRDGAASGGGAHPIDEVQLAAAALLVEVAMLDGAFTGDERDRIEGQLRDRFGLADEELALLVEAAEDEVRHAAELHGFTRRVKNAFTPEERIAVVEMLWQVVYADGTAHAYESNLVRRICGLLYVPDAQSGAARKRALAALGLPADTV
jgi:uncharacterized tellurite resistance protein B-like protein